MGSRYTKAQKEASIRYANSTDQFRIRTDKGNLDFIKEHASEMNETLGQFVNRAIMEAVYRDRGEIVVENVYSDEYALKGTLLLSQDDYYEIDTIINGKRSITKLDARKDVPQQFVSDYGWMLLENIYEDTVLQGTPL